MLDWFAPHLDPKVDDLIHSAGHAVLRIGGHLTGLVQVEDTHAHASYSAKYKQEETQAAWEQLLIRPDKLPSTSRQTVMDRAMSAWSHVDHVMASRGFVCNGIANALDGSEDDQLSEDVAPFWHELRMSEVREDVRREVEAAVSHGRVSRFEEYGDLLEPYPLHAALQEGQEAFGIEVDGRGELGSNAGSATEDDDDGVRFEGDDDHGDVDLTSVGLAIGTGDGARATSQSHGQAAASGPARQEVVASSQALVALASTQAEDGEDEDTKLARTSLQSAIDRRHAANVAALEAARAVGGDAQLVQTLSARLRVLSRQQREAGSRGRVRLRAMSMQQKAENSKFRAESVALEDRERKLKLQVKIKTAEVAVAKAKSKEAAAAAKNAETSMRLRAKEEVARQATEKKEQDRQRIKYAGKLCGAVNDYMLDKAAGLSRMARAGKLAKAAAAKNAGRKQLPVPRFWPPSTAGMEKVTTPKSLGLRAKPEAFSASPDFVWTLSGGRRALAEDPKRALRKLMERLMPEYFTVLGARYGVDGLLAESHGVLDVAFMAANWRYTQIVGAQQYRCGLHRWPPVSGWETSSMLLEALPAAAPPPASSHVHHGADVKGREQRGASSHKDRGPVGDVWQLAADGELVRTEDGCRQLLAERGLVVRPSETHGRNNCLIDSLLQALSHAGSVTAGLPVAQRRDVCARARGDLMLHHGASDAGYLEHDVHGPSVFKYLVAHEPGIWRDGVDPRLVELTVTVFDRFSCREELAPTEPVLVPSLADPALGHDVRHEQVQLYACTHLDGTGWHYEWVHGV